MALGTRGTRLACLQSSSAQICPHLSLSEMVLHGLDPLSSQVLFSLLSFVSVR